MQECDFCKKQAVYLCRMFTGTETYVCQDHRDKYDMPIILELGEVTTKKCSMCLEEKKIDQFHVGRSECKECNSFIRKKARMRRCRT